MTTPDPSAHLSFRLADEFVARYADRPVDWGFPVGGGNSLGELTFLTKYSRVKDDGTKERWHETCRRVIEGMFSIQKDHCKTHRIPWNGNKAQRTAEDAFERMFTFRWLPPGRGIWMMGTPLAMQTSACLQNCMFISTEPLNSRQPTLPFVRLMEASMLGVGVGFDTYGTEKIVIHAPTGDPETFVIPDTREGWCESVDRLLRSYFVADRHPLTFDYSLIRPAGTPIKTFGGTAAGPAPLAKLHDMIRRFFDGRDGQRLTSTDIVDVMNAIGKCVVAGNVRRSAELALGLPDDKAYVDLKNWEVNPERMGADGWGYLSNNSVFAEVGGNYDHLIDRIVLNGEPGLVFMDLSRAYGRLGDPPNNRDYRVKGYNPCAEQPLEHMECCTLVETFPTRCDDKDDYLKTLKVAYLYGKTVTLLSTHWEETNEVMTRNRRIGTSMSGTAQFAEAHGWSELRRWCEAGYDTLRHLDVNYSEWLGVRESIKVSTSKPSGTVSLLAGVWPGVHWPVAEGDYIRRQRFRVGDPIVDALTAAGFPVEPDVMDPDHTVVVAFPTSGPAGRSEREVTVWEKSALAALLQRYWSDNSVSVTLSFRPDEADQIGSVIRAFDGQLKTMSFLPMGDAPAYAQMPYEAIDADTFAAMRAKVQPIDWTSIYANGAEAEGERFCTNDSCAI